MIGTFTTSYLSNEQRFRNMMTTNSVGDLELITTTVLSSTATAVSFSLTAGQQATYKNLQIRYTGRSTSAVDYTTVLLTFNSDAAANYVYHLMYGNGASVQPGVGATQTSITLPWITGANKTANAFSGAYVDILDAFSTSKNKTTKSFGGWADGAVSLVSANGGTWFSNAAISSISLAPTNVSFAIGSRFSLYGVRG